MAIRESRVAATYKLQPRTRQLVAVLAEALGRDKSSVIEEAVARLSKDKRSAVRQYLREAEQSFESLDRELQDKTPGEVLSGVRRRTAVTARR